MKRAKIMLMAITVLAITGGVLAFKAKTVNGLIICTTNRAGIDIDTVDKFCPSITTNYTFTDDLGIPIFYTKDVDGTCPVNLHCSTWAYTNFRA